MSCAQIHPPPIVLDDPGRETELNTKTIFKPATQGRDHVHAFTGLSYRSLVFISVLPLGVLDAFRGSMFCFL